MTKFNNALITGASSGIGAEIAKRLARMGSHVVLVARREHLLRQVAEGIARDGGEADWVVADVSDHQQIAHAVKEWDSKTGGLDLVVANAGVGRMRPAHRLEWEDIEPVINVNITGAFATLLAGVQCMVPRKRGTLAAVSSLAAMRGLPASGAYSASKAALSTFLDTLRADLHSRGIHVVDIRPGFVRTPMTEPNKFHMPLLMDAEDAANIAVRGMEHGRSVVAFPWAMAKAMSLAQSAPDLLWRTIIAKR